MHHYLAAYLGTHVFCEIFQPRQRVSQFYLVLTVQQHAEQSVRSARIGNHLTQRET